MIRESLPETAFSPEDRTFLSETEADLRPKMKLLDLQQKLRLHNPELFREIAQKSSDLAPGNPKLHAFFFTEFLLLASAVHRIENTANLDPDWADDPPILSY